MANNAYITANGKTVKGAKAYIARGGKTVKCSKAYLVASGKTVKMWELVASRLSDDFIKAIGYREE